MPTSALTWAHALGSHSGHFPGDFATGRKLLEWGYPVWGEYKAGARRSGRTAVALSVLTALLAAAAGVSVLPKTISVAFSAAVAFCATIVSLLILALDPQGKAARRRSVVTGCERLRESIEDYARWLNDLPETAERAEIDSRLAALRAQRDLIVQIRDS